MPESIDDSLKSAAAIKTALARGRTRRVRRTGKSIESRVQVINRSDKGGLIKHALKINMNNNINKRKYYYQVFSASPEDRIVMIRDGVPANYAKIIIKDLGIEQKTFYDALGLKTATVNRKVQHDAVLSSNESERLLGVAKLIGQLEVILAESGDPEDFNVHGWMSNWLSEPLPAFGGKKPMSFLDTMEGQALVSDALAQIQSGAYA